MRIVLGVESLRWPPLTGVGHYTMHLLAGLLAEPGIDLRCLSDGVLVPPPVAVEGEADARRGPPGATLRLKRLASRVPGVSHARFLVRDAMTRRRFPAIGGSVHHEPNHILRTLHGPSVVTVHDLSVLHFPGFHPKDRVRYFERHFARSSEGADIVIADSEFIRRDLLATLNLDPAKIRVVPLGVGPEFRPTTLAAQKAVLDRHGLAPGRYLLAVGTREPRKNLERLIDAYLDLPREARARHVLALAGPRGWRAEALERRIAALERDGSVRSLGYVPDQARPALYGGASGFAYPSLYEGFGLPPLEAAACGTPVLTSIDSPMAEVLDGVAELVDPLDTAAITAGLARILTDPDMRRAAAFAGPRRAAAFGWDACVARTMAVYDELAADQAIAPGARQLMEAPSPL
jgi:alpha-1,3-rhamnosyl/mannosyltransferase